MLYIIMMIPHDVTKKPYYWCDQEIEDWHNPDFAFRLTNERQAERHMEEQKKRHLGCDFRIIETNNCQVNHLPDYCMFKHANNIAIKGGFIEEAENSDNDTVICFEISENVNGNWHRHLHVPRRIMIPINTLVELI